MVEMGSRSDDLQEADMIIICKLKLFREIGARWHNPGLFVETVPRNCVGDLRVTFLGWFRKSKILTRR